MSLPLPSPALLVQSCAGQFQVTGGKLINIDSGNSGATCPAGTYSVTSPAEEFCPPCPTGYTCTGGAKTACGAGEQACSLGEEGCAPAQISSFLPPERLPVMPAYQAPTHSPSLADKYNSFLGKSDNAADCDTCDANANPRYTSLSGADYCTVPYIDITCGDGGRGMRADQGCAS